MRFFRPCDGCTAKESEIQRLTTLVNSQRTHIEHLADKVLEMARDATGLTKQVEVQKPLPDPFPADLKEWIDARFTTNSPIWRHQMGQARKLIGDGKDAATIKKLLNRGEAVEV